jgi:phosphohistidine phosphatase
MDIFIVRHADAVPFSEFNGPDEERFLTERGHQEAKRLAELLLAKSLIPSQILCSPLVRARETATDLHQLLGLEASQLGLRRQLAPGGKFRKLAKFLNKSQFSSVLLVGHMPDLSELTGWLIGSRKVELNFDKTGMACVRVSGDEVEKGSGQLLWFVNPEWYG